MYELPTAFFLAPLEDVRTNPYVMFRLVRPTPPTRLQKRGGVESAAGLVNVIPQRRIYRMETVEEIEIFKRELLKRPLVLQSVSHSGMGCGNGALGCGFFTNDRNWVLLINQTHPKVLGRLQMGCDAAKHAMQRGDPFVLRFRFGTLLQRLHTELFQNDVILSPAMQYTEWEFAQLVVRFPGSVREIKANPAAALVATPCRELNFDFADIQVHEIKYVTNNHRMVLRGPIPAVTEDEIRELLPAWTVNDLTPLEEMGEERPETYNYAQAGRLYESFRKKKRQRPKVGDEPEPERPNSRMPRRTLAGAPPEDTIELDDINTNMEDDGGFGDEARRYAPEISKAPVKPERRNRRNYGQDTEKRADGFGPSHLYPDIQVVDKQRNRAPSNDPADWNRHNRGPRVAGQFDQGPHRDSDRSSNSAGESTATGADSGYSGDDGYGGYYGNRRPQAGYNGLHYSNIEEKYGSTTKQKAHENLGFHDNDHRKDDILVKHQDYVTKMLKNSGGNDRYNYQATRDEYRYGDRYDSREDNYDRYGACNGPSPGGDYYNQSRSRGYSDYEDSVPPPSYGDVTTTQARSKFQIQEPEAMAESFI